MNFTLPQPIPLAPCKVCDAPSPRYDCVDFNKSCEDHKGCYLPRSGIAVHYRRCPSCGFIFTDAFDHWSEAEFQEHIYNEEYIKVDPEYAVIRPEANAQMLIRQFAAHKQELRVLDWGGGNGLLAQRLREAGFARAETYDPFTPEFAIPPNARCFNLVTCFETLEHLPHPKIGAISTAYRLQSPGVILFSTALQPPDIKRQRLHWRYAAPRNGHISLFSHEALCELWARVDLKVHSFNNNVHVAFKERPSWLAW